MLHQYKSTNTDAFSGWQEAERKVLAGELVKRQIEAKDKMLLQNDIRKTQQIEHDDLEVRALIQP